MTSNPKEFSHPKCWENKAKMQMLFSTFRPRHLNIEDYDAKMNFWKDLIYQLCEAKGKVYFSQRELQIQFSRGEQIPACLDAVIMDMQKCKLIRLRNEFQSDPYNTWRNYILNNFLWKPISWSWQMLKNSLYVTQDFDASLLEWCHLSLLRSYCKELDTKVLCTNRGKVMNFSLFELACNESNLQIDSEALQLCLLELHVQEKIGLEYKNENRIIQISLIKIPQRNGSERIITEEDHAIQKLHFWQENQRVLLERLEVQLKDNDEKLHQYLNQKQRNMAKLCLKKKHLLEKNHERHLTTLHNIETLLSSVDEAQNNSAVLDAYQLGTKTLQKLLNESGLNCDNVDDVLNSVRDTLDQYSDIQDAMSNSSLNVSESEEFDLDQELTLLISENAAKESEPVEDVSAKDCNHGLKILSTDDNISKVIHNLQVEDGPISDNQRNSRKQLQTFH